MKNRVCDFCQNTHSIPTVYGTDVYRLWKVWYHRPGKWMATRPINGGVVVLQVRKLHLNGANDFIFSPQNSFLKFSSNSHMMTSFDSTWRHHFSGKWSHGPEIDVEFSPNWQEMFLFFILKYGVNINSFDLYECKLCKVGIYFFSKGPGPGMFAICKIQVLTRDQACDLGNHILLCCTIYLWSFKVFAQVEPWKTGGGAFCQNTHPPPLYRRPMAQTYTDQGLTTVPLYLQSIIATY